MSTSPPMALSDSEEDKSEHVEQNNRNKWFFEQFFYLNDGAQRTVFTLSCLFPSMSNQVLRQTCWNLSEHGRHFLPYFLQEGPALGLLRIAVNFFKDQTQRHALEATDGSPGNAGLDGSRYDDFPPGLVMKHYWGYKGFIGDLDELCRDDFETMNHDLEHNAHRKGIDYFQLFIDVVVTR